MYTITCCQSFCSSREETPSCYQRKKIRPRQEGIQRKRTSAVKTSDPKPSTSQDKPASEQQPQDESVSEQQPQDESVSEQQPQDEPVPDQPQDEPVPEQQQDELATKQDKASDTLTSLSSDDEIPDYGPALKIFTTQDPSSVPKKSRYSLRPKTK